MFLESSSKLIYLANWPKSLFWGVIEKDKEKKKKPEPTSKKQRGDVWQIMEYILFLKNLYAGCWGLH